MTPPSDSGKEALPGELLPAKLPSPNTKRWTARRKAEVLIAVSDGRLPREEACRRYQLSEEELLAWEAAFKTYGNPGLFAYALHSSQLRHRLAATPDHIEADEGGTQQR